MATNEITAFFKGRTGVAEPLYQYDVGQVLVIDGIEDLPTPFEAEYEMSGAEETIPAVGQEYRVAIPNSVLSLPGIVKVYIPIHEGETDTEVEYIARFGVIGRARPVDDGTSEEQTAISQAIALLRARYNTLMNDVKAAVREFLPDEVAEQFVPIKQDILEELQAEIHSVKVFSGTASGGSFEISSQTLLDNGISDILEWAVVSYYAQINQSDIRRKGFYGSSDTLVWLENYYGAGAIKGTLPDSYNTYKYEVVVMKTS